MKMFRLSKLTDYAVVVMIRLAQGADIQTSPGVARATGIPEPTVAKVLKILSHAGLAQSQRGATGGYRLSRPLSAIPVADIIQALDGPIALTSCVDGGGCDSATLCPMHGRWDPVNDAIRTALHGITLADMQAALTHPARTTPDTLSLATGLAPASLATGLAPASLATGLAPASLATA